MYEKRISTVIRILKNPNQSLREICYNENNYLIFGLVIIALAGIFSMSLITAPPDESASFNHLGYALISEPVYEITETVFSFLASILLIVMVFLIGKRVGGIDNFKKIFATQSCSVFPALIGGILSNTILFVLPYVIPETPVGAEPPFQYFPHVVYFGIYGPFGIWSLIIAIKAIKIPNGFGTGKAIGIFLLSLLIVSLILVPANWLLGLL